MAGFPVGTSMDTNIAMGRFPALTREKYAEAHELIMRCWQEDEPFVFNGRFNKLRYANCWPKPIQKNPPIFIPGGGSLETYDFCLENDYVYCYLSFTGYLRAKQLMDGYWARVEEAGKDLSPYRAGFAQTIVVAETDAEPSVITASTSTTSITDVCTCIPALPMRRATGPLKRCKPT